MRPLGADNPMSDFQRQANELANDFRSFGQKARTKLARAVESASILVERDAKKLFKGRGDASVSGEPPRVDTGRLRASITHRISSDSESVYGEIGTNVEYAAGLEFGTSRTWPHPFMTPALSMNEKKITEILAEAVSEAVENA